MPSSIKVARILMLAVSGVAGALAGIVLLLSGITAESLALACWIAVPGAVNLWLALALRAGRIGVRRAILALQVFYVLLALGSIGQGDPAGLANLVLPLVIAVLLTRPAATRYLRSQG